MLWQARIAPRRDTGDLCRRGAGPAAPRAALRAALGDPQGRRPHRPLHRGPRARDGRLPARRPRSGAGDRRRAHHLLVPGLPALSARPRVPHSLCGTRSGWSAPTVTATAPPTLALLADRYDPSCSRRLARRPVRLAGAGPEPMRRRVRGRPGRSWSARLARPPRRGADRRRGDVGARSPMTCAAGWTRSAPGGCGSATICTSGSASWPPPPARGEGGLRFRQVQTADRAALGQRGRDPVRR